MYKGQEVFYSKDGILMFSLIDSWCIHENFTEVFLINGDVICESEIKQSF